ncbi:hypothetical protein B296_00041957 [Ensete ventricosum]|uniref:Uncharacterized protein n=1 Tax=Ensete ventricosum TaxID=4639 RepID=A0A426YJF1_ENSVE|nr:hypothetical protein B296_00041957 [Ensete ventricosum]
MAWMLLASRLERDVEVFVMQWPLPDLGSRISFSCRGAVTVEAGPPKMTSICFSTGPLSRGDEPRGGRPSRREDWSRTYRRRWPCWMRSSI